MHTQARYTVIVLHTVCMSHIYEFRVLAATLVLQRAKR